MSEQKVLVRQTVKIMKGDKVISEKVVFQKAPEIKIEVPPPIQKPVSPPISPTSKEKRPEFMEPTPSPTSLAYRKAMEEDMKRRQQEFLVWEAKQPGTWMREIENLERYRQKYNKKANWSASDLAAVEAIDKRIQECLSTLQELQEEDDYYEDSDSE